MYGIGGDPFGGDRFGRHDQGLDAGDRLVGRIMAAEYNLGVQQGGTAGRQLADQSLSRLIGMWLNRLYS